MTDQDWSKYPTYDQAYRSTLRDFDKDPMIVHVEGHRLVVRNNTVTHDPKKCGQCHRNKLERKG